MRSIRTGDRRRQFSQARVVVAAASTGHDPMSDGSRARGSGRSDTPTAAHFQRGVGGFVTRAATASPASSSGDWSGAERCQGGSGSVNLPAHLGAGGVVSTERREPPPSTRSDARIGRDLRSRPARAGRPRRTRTREAGTSGIACIGPLRLRSVGSPRAGATTAISASARYAMRGRKYNGEQGSAGHNRSGTRRDPEAARPTTVARARAF